MGPRKGPSVKGRGRTRRTPGVMNKLESDYAEELERRRLAGEIYAWVFEPMNFRLAKKCFYNPDFMVVMADGLIEFHETKGFYEATAKIRNKVVARDHPWFVFRLVQRIKKKDGGGFAITVIGPAVEGEDDE